jgi:DNA-binding MarR family transcriptional regulator
MITRDPDVTRLLARLEKRRLIRRAKSKADKRVICTQLAPAGRRILKNLDAAIAKAHREQLSRLGRDRLKSLIHLLEAAREK